MDKALIMMAIEDLSDFQLNENIEELKNLALACEMETVDVVTQNIKKKSNAFYIGKGKVEELKNAAEAQEADLVIFNIGLTPSQIRNLEEEIGVEIVDKNMLVLEIFSRRAVTPISKAQVEIAQLKYVFPRMIGSYAHLGRQGGASGTKNKGLGETKLELDRRNVGQRIRYLEKVLKENEKTREITRAQKTSGALPLVSLVGYTNAGKSSFMNMLLAQELDKHVFVKDMLFASLETYSRKITLENNRSFILNDTVGFINDLPHDLVPAFHATLEEIETSNMLIHLVDLSNPNYESHIETINDTLETLEIAETPILTVFNKIDLLDNVEPLVNTDTAYISIKENLGIEALIKRIEEILWQDEEEMEFLFPYSKMNLVEQVLSNYNIVESEHLDDGVYIKVNAKVHLKKMYSAYLVNGR
ncbi:MAG: GTPase HflX [Erysipelothrix sp.]|nr:GTPase HflX [Erysipelothrix sp.]